MLDELPSGLSYSAVGCEVNVNDSTGMLNKASLNTNTRDGVIISSVAEMLWPEACRKLTPFPQGQRLSHLTANSVLAATSESTATVNNKALLSISCHSEAPPGSS